MEKTKILIIEDDDGIRSQMKWALNQEYDVLLAQNTKEAINIMIQFSPSLVTLDLGLPPGPEGTDEGFRLLQEILKMSQFTKVIVVTGTPEKDAPLRALSRGAHDFLAKPINLEELKTVANRVSKDNIQARVSYDRRRNERRHDRSVDSAFEISLPDQNRRHSARRCEAGRRNERRNISLKISTPDQVGKTINVSESGVYFEVITNDINVLSPGTTIPLKITAANATPGFDGRGTVIRNCLIEYPDHDDSLCVALELTENLILY